MTYGHLALSTALQRRGLRRGVAGMPATLRDAGVESLLPGPVVSSWVNTDGMQPARGPSGLLAEEALVSMVTDTAAGAGCRLELGRGSGGDRRGSPALLALLIAAKSCGGAGLVFIDGHEDAWNPPAGLTRRSLDLEIGLALGLFPDRWGPPGCRACAPNISCCSARATRTRSRTPARPASVTRSPRYSSAERRLAETEQPQLHRACGNGAATAPAVEVLAPISTCWRHRHWPRSITRNRADCPGRTGTDHRGLFGGAGVVWVPASSSTTLNSTGVRGGTHRRLRRVYPSPPRHTGVLDMASKAEEIDVDGVAVRLTSRDKP